MVEAKKVVKEHQRYNAGRKKRSTPDETVESVHDLSLEGKTCQCYGAIRPMIKQERSEEFDLIPAKVIRIGTYTTYTAHVPVMASLRAK